MTINAAVDAVLRRDTCLRQRPQGGTDAEGFPKTEWETVGSMVGAWGTPSSADRETAGRNGQTVSAVFQSKTAAELGDRLTGLRGHNWIVTNVTAGHIAYRHFLDREN